MNNKLILAFFSLLVITACTPVEDTKVDQEEITVIDEENSLYNYASSTISPEAKAIINTFTSAISKPDLPSPEEADPRAFSLVSAVQVGLARSSSERSLRGWSPPPLRFPRPLRRA